MSSQEWLDYFLGPAFQRPPDPRVIPAGASRAEAQARTVLRWYSPSWREAHGEELVATVLDAAMAQKGGRRTDPPLPLRTRLELARAGYLQRRRSRPSFWRRFELLQGRDSMSWGDLAWLRDRLDQRGALWLLLQCLIFWCIYWSMLPLVMAGVFGTGELQPGSALLEMVILFVVMSLAVPILLFFIRILDGRRRWFSRARLSEAGWPLAWNPPPPRYALQPAPPPPSGTDFGPPVAS